MSYLRIRRERKLLKRISFWIMLTISLMSMLTLAFNIKPVKASGTIYIKADGSIAGTNKIVSADNVTYTFTDDINDSIVVERDNIVVDGAGYMLQGNGSVRGIDLSNRKNVTICNMEIRGFQRAIYLSWSSDINIYQNNLTANSAVCIDLRDSSNNSITHNTISNNDNVGIGLTGSSNNDIVGNVITANFRGAYVDSSSNNNITGNIIAGNTAVDGIDFWDSSFITLVGNNITNNKYYGIAFYGSAHNCTLIGNNITANERYGVYFDGSLSNVTFSENTVASHSQAGVRVGSLYTNSSYFIFDRNVIEENNNGLSFYALSHSVIVGNNVTSNSLGIDIENSSNIIVENNNVTNNSGGGIGVFGEYNIVSGNSMTLNGDGVIVGGSLNNIVGNNMTSNYAGIAVGGEHNIVSGNNMKLNTLGISLGGSLNNIVGNNMTSNYYGIYFVFAIRDTISGNIIANNYDGIYSAYSSNNTVIGNNIEGNNDAGIRLHDSSNSNTIIGNNITANSNRGINVWGSSHNAILENNITGNNLYGIRFYQASHNLVYHNNFVNNTIQTYIYDSVNVWDDGYPSGGNYWSDHNVADVYCGRKQDILGSDGIGDTKYVIAESNIDNYPFMKPNGWQNYPISIETNVTITDKTIRETAMFFTVSGPTGQIGYVNVTMPVGLNSTKIKVFIDNKLVSPPFPIITTNGTHYFIYFEFTLSTHHIIIQYAMINIAVTNITLSKPIVGQGYNVLVNVTVHNQGDSAETFNIKVYANTFFINMTEVTLSGGDSTTITFTWNTTGFAIGNYTINAVAETDFGNNTLSAGKYVCVSIVGDLDCDRDVDLYDAVKLLTHYGAKEGQPEYYPLCDIDGDGDIDLYDAVALLSHYGQKYP
jgi:parallel beta-helix repeat protein